MNIIIDVSNITMTVPSKVHADYFYKSLFYDFHSSVSLEKLVLPFTFIGFAYYDHLFRRPVLELQLLVEFKCP